MLLELLFELLGGVVQALLAAVIFWPIGFIYLHLRYRNRTRAHRAQQLAQRYENDYTNAGRSAAVNIFAGIFILLLLALLVGAPLAHWLAA